MSQNLEQESGLEEAAGFDGEGEGAGGASGEWTVDDSSEHVMEFFAASRAFASLYFC